MRQVDIARGPVTDLPALHHFYAWCRFCGVLPLDASASREAHFLQRVYIAFLWLSLAFVTLVDIIAASSREGPAAWSASAVAIITCIACAISFSLARGLFASGILTTRCAQALSCSRDRGLTRHFLNSRLRVALALGIAAAAAGIAADALDGRALLADPSSRLAQRLGRLGVMVYTVCAVAVQLQATVGVVAVVALLAALRARVRAASRALTVDEAQTSAEEAVRRLLDADITIAHAAHKFASDAALVAIAFGLKFLLCALAQVTANAKERLIARAGPAGALDMVVQPVLVCLGLLLAAGALNADVDYLTRACGRFTLRHRALDRRDGKLAKALQAHAKGGELEFCLQGVAVRPGAAWKVLALGVSTYILLLRFKRWGII